jgi:hypothetical protein
MQAAGRKKLIADSFLRGRKSGDFRYGVNMD